MNIKLKNGKTFTDEKTGVIYSELYGGIKHMTFSFENMDFLYKIKFYGSVDLMNQGKSEIFIDIIGITDQDLIDLLTSAPVESTIKEDIEIKLYNYVLSLQKYNDFEIV